MVLKISQEISSIAQSAADAVDLITNQRIVETTVIVDDGEILVLGGLIEETLLESDQAVPVLGKIPGLGFLFRSRKTEKKKTNLMIFIRAEIMRDTAETAFQTNSKYNMIREIQKGNLQNEVLLMPDEQRPIIPPLTQQQIDKANGDGDGDGDGGDDGSE